MSYFESVVRIVVEWMKKGFFVVIESIVFLLMIVKMVKFIEEIRGFKVGEDFYMVYVFERVMFGRIFKEFVYNFRIFGGIILESLEIVEKFYCFFVKG